MYNRILTRLLNTPLAISQEKLDVITSSVTLRLLAGENIPSLSADLSTIPGLPSSEEQSTEPSIGVIKVYDSLVSHNGAGDSGSTSYESIDRQISYAKAEGVTDLVFQFSSPGGEVEGLFPLAQTIYNLRNEGITTHGVATGNACSAAYVMLAACQKTYATSSSVIGSMGVIMTLVNTVKADAKDGYEYTIVRSKDEKAMLNSHEPFSKEALAKAKTQLMEFDSLMNDTINSFRPSLSVEDIIKLNGNTVLGNEAVELNLIDGVVSSFQDVISGILNSKDTKAKTSTTNIGANKMADPTTLILEEQVQALQAELTANKLALVAAEATGVEKATKLMKDIKLAATTIGVPMGVADNCIEAGLSLSEATKQMQLLKQNMQLLNPSPSANGLQPTADPKASEDEVETDEITLLAEAVAKRGSKLTKYVPFGSEGMTDLEAADELFSRYGQVI